jgi:hypothetical protein
VPSVQYNYEASAYRLPIEEVASYCTSARAELQVHDRKYRSPLRSLKLYELFGSFPLQKNQRVHFGFGFQDFSTEFLRMAELQRQTRRHVFVTVIIVISHRSNSFYDCTDFRRTNAILQFFYGCINYFCGK